SGRSSSARPAGRSRPRSGGPPPSGPHRRCPRTGSSCGRLRRRGGPARWRYCRWRGTQPRCTGRGPPGSPARTRLRPRSGSWVAPAPAARRASRTGRPAPGGPSPGGSPAALHRPPPWLPPRRRTVGGYGRKPFAVSLTHAIADLNFYADPAQCFPFDVYDEDGSNRREKITDWALKQFRSHYQDKKISKWDVFHDVYGLLHHPGDRTKFADNLKKSLPRIPFAPDFRAFATAGKQLADLHVNDEQ